MMPPRRMKKVYGCAARFRARAGGRRLFITAMRDASTRHPLTRSKTAKGISRWRNNFLLVAGGLVERKMVVYTRAAQGRERPERARDNSRGQSERKLAPPPEWVRKRLPTLKGSKLGMRPLQGRDHKSIYNRGRRRLRLLAPGYYLCPFRGRTFQASFVNMFSGVGGR